MTAPANLYAWKNGSYIVYTESETPSVGDNLYNASGEVITSVGDYGYISIQSVSGSSLTLYYEPL